MTHRKGEARRPWFSYAAYVPRRALIRTALLVLSVVAASPVSALEVELGGQFRLAGDLSCHGGDTALARAAGATALQDGAATLRFDTRTAFSDRMSLTVHYEAVAAGGDTRRALAAAGAGELYGTVIPEDDRRLVDLTRVVRERDGGVLYHRLDRLHFDHTLPRGLLRLGRQALSWGNGLLFNPADLVNPFSPADVVRDYKIGTDMLLLQAWGERVADFQLALVPRRDSGDGDFSAKCSSAAARVRRSRGPREADLMLAYHYDTLVAGAGLSGFFGGAAWRTDVTWAVGAGAAGGPESYVSAVINLDYSWAWGGKNWYGFVEGYYDGAGEPDAETALADPWILALRERGELHLTGRHYLAGHLRCEVHPLVNLMVTVIGNLDDGSLVCQPRLAWDVTRALDLLLGADLPVGGRGSEFGTRRLPLADIPGGTEFSGTVAVPTRLYLQLTRYF
ncbi:MAG: hypothetical protein JW781_11095 [Deltaproteobacteria bacterium]|nr:hypothetical protein [Candidatus Anaeroferrophillacea bacterium]